MKFAISTHFSNDDARLYSFVRDSRLPHGTFDAEWRITPNRALWVVVGVLAGLLIAVCV